MRFIRSFVACTTATSAALVLMASSAYAQKLESVHKDWRVFTIQQGGSKVCYIASVPTKKAGNYNKRGEPFAIITYRGSNKYEVSLSSGYPYKKEAPLHVQVDATTYKLFVDGDRGWAYDEAQDAKLVANMKKGSRMVVKGTSRLGTSSSDTYSLSGFSAALSSLGSLCK